MDIFPDLNIAADEAVGKQTDEDGKSYRDDAAEEEEIAAAVGTKREAAQQDSGQVPVPQNVRHLKLQPTQRPSVQ